MVVSPAGSHWDENGKIAMSGESQDIDLVWTKNNIHPRLDLVILDLVKSSI